MVFKWVKNFTSKNETIKENNTSDAITEEENPADIEHINDSVGMQEEEEKNISAETQDEAEKDTPVELKENKGWFNTLFSGLGKSAEKLTGGITQLFTHSKLDDEALEELQDILIMSDLGVSLSQKYVDTIAKNRYGKEITDTEIREALASEMEKTLAPLCKPLEFKEGLSSHPQVILMIGVNGSGKTTTIGKLAQKFTNEGRRVMLGAGDTFRAAAVEQLEVWGKRIGVPVITKQEGADPASLVYEAITEAKKQEVDIVLLDTAGRLHTKDHLMQELEKINRVVKKLIPEAPHDTIIVLDGTVGQNALEQVKYFAECVPISGIIMTKLDGTAKGGVLLNLAHTHNIPIHAIGVGEKVEDLNSFKAEDFAKGLLNIQS